MRVGYLCQWLEGDHWQACGCKLHVIVYTDPEQPAKCSRGERVLLPVGAQNFDAFIEVEKALFGDEPFACDQDLLGGCGAQVLIPTCVLSPAGGNYRFVPRRAPAYDLEHRAVGASTAASSVREDEEAMSEQAPQVQVVQSEWQPCEELDNT